MNTNSINFGAKPINNITIRKYNKKNGVYENFPAKFVKLDPNNFSDIIAVDKAAKNWEDALYINKIATASHWMNKLPIEIYALTTQQDKFNKLQPSRILGFAEIRKDGISPDYNLLHSLQVKPQAINVSGNNKSYKYVGTSIIKSLKRIYKNISLFSANNPCLENFYKKNGFIEDIKHDRHYMWSSNIFKMLKLRFEKFLYKNGI